MRRVLTQRILYQGISLVVQGLRLHARDAGAPSSIPGWGTRSRTPSTKGPATTKTWHSQITKKTKEKKGMLYLTSISGAPTLCGTRDTVVREREEKRPQRGPGFHGASMGKANVNLLIRSATMTSEEQGAASTYDPGDDASLKGETGHL